MLFTKVKNFYRMLITFKPNSLLRFYKLKYLTRQNNDTHFIKLKNGLSLSVNKSAGDLTTLFEIFINDDYSFAGDNKQTINILDIGANVGYFTLFIIKKFPNSRVFSFEPFPETFKRLTENINNNAADNIKANFPS